MFRRWERPDYALTAGQYCYDRLNETLKREEFYFNCGASLLKGYYYCSEGVDKLIVLVHGYRSGADDFLPMIDCFVKSGFNVFCYDATGVYDSKGRSTIGMCQALVDLDNCLNYLKSSPKFSLQSLYLVGHSLGGYAVSSVLALHKNVKACVALAPLNNGATIMVEKGQEYIGRLANLYKPFICLMQKMRFGDYVNYDGIGGINSVKVPVLIVQGSQDKVVKIDKTSIMAKRKQIINPNVQYLEIRGVRGGHNELWHSKRSVDYQNQIKQGLKSARKQKGRRLTYQEKKDYYKGVDNALYSQVSKSLMSKITKFFSAAV